MNGEAVKELATRLRGPFLLDDFIVRPNDWVTEDPEALVKPAPAAKAMGVATLGAVRDYLQANRDGLPLDKLIVHIEGPARVTVGGALRERSRDRELYVTATALDLTDGFLGKFMSLEEFIIGLQVRCVDADDRQRLLQLLSNVKHETVKAALDDGMTQVVQVRAGVVMVTDVAVPNPVTLTAFRTFRDIMQPSSLFVLRVNGGRQGGLPEVGLFEADGGAWKLATIARVRDWLVGELPDAVAVLG